MQREDSRTSWVCAPVSRHSITCHRLSLPVPVPVALWPRRQQAALVYEDTCSNCSMLDLLNAQIAQCSNCSMLEFLNARISQCSKPPKKCSKSPVPCKNSKFKNSKLRQSRNNSKFKIQNSKFKIQKSPHNLLHLVNVSVERSAMFELQRTHGGSKLARLCYALAL